MIKEQTFLTVIRSKTKVNVVISAERWQHFCQKWKYRKNMQADHNLIGLYLIIWLPMEFLNNFWNLKNAFYFYFSTFPMNTLHQNLSKILLRVSMGICKISNNFAHLHLIAHNLQHVCVHEYLSICYENVNATSETFLNPLCE